LRYCWTLVSKKFTKRIIWILKYLIAYWPIQR
jgi:hypothetical protein